MTVRTESQPALARCSVAVHHYAGPTALIRVLRLGGEIDLTTCSTLRSALDAALSGAAGQPTAHLVIDLGEVTFCSARGHSLLHFGAESARSSGISYTLAGLSPHLDRMAATWAGEHVARYPRGVGVVAAIRHRQALAS